MGKGFTEGAGYFKQGLSLIKEPAFRWFVITPLLLNIAVFALFFYFAGEVYSSLVNWFMGFLPEWLAFLSWLLWLVYGTLVVVILAYGFVMAANLIGSPFYGILSELVQKKLAGQVPEVAGGWQAVLASIPQAIFRESSKILYYLPRAIGLLVLGFIPIINLFAAVLWFLFSSWMMAIQYVDYPSDNNRQKFGVMRRKLALDRGQALGFGMPVFIGSMIPVVNLVIVPAAVCGATAYWVGTKAMQEQETAG
ncbi:MAG: sulfate transporter CysZ [Gammaproteobacteria bacterium]|nr:MAG: sulfate transporter CysZ [Gammaproteobacteria bacterium]